MICEKNYLKFFKKIHKNSLKVELDECGMKNNLRLKYNYKKKIFVCLKYQLIPVYIHIYELIHGMVVNKTNLYQYKLLMKYKL